MDNMGKNLQFVNILFSGYRSRSTIIEKCEPKPILARAQVPQRVITYSLSMDGK